jgi:hypothetical protein
VSRKYALRYLNLGFAQFFILPIFSRANCPNFLLMKSRWSILLLVITITWTAESPIHADSCVTKTCISVTTDAKRGGIIITATKNSPGGHSSPKPQRVDSKPRRKLPILRTRSPLPRQPTSQTNRKSTRRTARVTPRVTTKINRVVFPKKVTDRTFTPKVVAAVSLTDQLTQLLPVAAIHFQPEPQGLTQVPVNFWTDTSLLFTTATVILGINVGVSLRPTLLWNFGDGTFRQTQNSGASFPTGGVLHTFREPGQYLVTLTVSWAGTWSAGGNSFPVLGETILQNLTKSITINPAPVKYLK